MFARFEWAIVELLVVAFLIYELIAVRRAVRRDRAAREKDKQP